MVISVTVRALKCDAVDTVAVVTQSVKAGTEIVATNGDCLTAKEDITVGHKIALQAIAAGDLVYKYGVPIGRASQNISVGEWVHTHNLTDITEKLCNQHTLEFRRKAGGAV